MGNLSDRLLLVVRCAKAPAKNYHFIFTVAPDDGSTRNRLKSNLKWVEAIDNPVRIDISSNWLTEVDLSPLANLNGLEYISIAVNKLETIDLTPLQNCKRLRHLDISHNNLKEIDLSPLAGCKDLRYLYLQENMFREVNIAPLYELDQLTTAVIQLTRHRPPPKIIIDSFMSNEPPNLNDILYAFITKHRAGAFPKWLYDKNVEIEYSPKSYGELVNEFGWAIVKEHLTALSKKIKIEIEFAAQQILLKAFGMSELACYDGRVRDIVKSLPISGSFSNGIRQLYSKMVDLLESQLKRGGSTLFFDMDALSTTPGCVLIPSLLARRDEEIQEVTLFDESGKIDLYPLWLTSYGSKILTAMGFERYASQSRISEIDKALRAINHSLSIKKVLHITQEKATTESTTGEVILSHVRQSGVC